MKQKNSRKLIMNACTRCGGAAYQEDPRDDEWRCLQCARTVPSPAAPSRTATPAFAARPRFHRSALSA